MAIDWSGPELVFLANQFKIGRASLFAGAGFSLGARNKFGDPLPLGGRLAELLATRAGATLKGESLPTVFEAVEPMIGTKNLWNYLTELYTVVEFDDWYKIVSELTWYRIYTTNIDNLFQHVAPYPSGQKLNTFVRGDWPEERDPHFEELQCIHLHGHIHHRVNGITFTLPDFALHTARPDPWYQSLVTDLYNGPFVFIGSSLEEPILTHYLELRELKPADAKHEYRPKSYLVSPSIGDLRAASLKRRNIVGIEATGEEFFQSLRDQLDLPALRAKSVQATVWPHLFSPDRRIDSDIARDFDLIVADSLPIVKTNEPSRFFLGAEPTWDDIAKERDGNREVNTTLVQKVTADPNGFQCFVLHGPAGSGKTASLMRVAKSLAESGHLVFFARGLERLSLDGILRLAMSDANKNTRIFVCIDVVSRHVGSIASVERELKDQPNLTLVLTDRTNRYASRCQRIAPLEPDEVKMPDLSEQDVESVLDRLDQFGFLGALKNKPRNEQIHEFMVRAKRQLLVALREATSGKEFDLILKDEFNELIPEAQLAYTICCIAVAKGAPGVYRKHLMPCIPRSRFTKGVVLEDLLRGVLVPGNATGTMLKPRHGLIAQWTATEIAPVELRYEALSTFLVQVSNHIVPNEIKKRTPPFLAYRGMVNCEGMFELLSGHTKDMLDLYEEIRAYYDGDFLFWLQYAMAQIKAGHLDIAENFLNQSLNIRPQSHQTLHQKGILFLIQATSADNPVAYQDRANEGMQILEGQIRSRGDYDSYPYHAYLTHVGRWYSHAGDLISQEQWEALRAVGNQARAKYRLDDTIKEAADEVEHRYLKKAVRKNDHTSE